MIKDDFVKLIEYEDRRINVLIDNIRTLNDVVTNLIELNLNLSKEIDELKQTANK